METETLQIDIPDTKTELKQPVCERQYPAWLAKDVPPLIILLSGIALAFLIFLRKRKEPANQTPLETVANHANSCHQAVKTLRKEFEAYRESTSKITNAQVMDTLVLLNRQQEDLQKDFNNLKIHLQENHLKLSKETVRRINKIEYRFLKYMGDCFEKKAKHQGQDQAQTTGARQGAEGGQGPLCKEESETGGVREEATSQRKGRGVQALFDSKKESPI